MRLALTLLFGIAGAMLLLGAVALGPSWFELHVALAAYPPLPAWVGSVLRCAQFLGGVGLLVLARWLWHRLGRGSLEPGQWLRIAFAIVLAVAAVELVLRTMSRRAAPWRADHIEVHLGRADPRYGWSLTPSQTTRFDSHGRVTAYAIDGWGDRAARADGAPDPALPSLVVAGESIAFGYGVELEQTFPGLLGQELGLQVVNTACPGYGADQALLRLGDALARLERPKVVVFTFLPVMLLRDVQDFRAHLVLRDGALVRVPGSSGLMAGMALRDFFLNELPYLSDRGLEQSLRLTAKILSEAAQEARSHGATPLFVAISIGPTRAFDAHPEAPWLRRLFVDQGLPFVLVDIDRSEFMPRQVHPGPQTHRRIASVIEAALAQASR